MSFWPVPVFSTIIQIEQKKNIDEGIKLLKRSISLDSTPNSRYVYFIRTIIDLAKANKADKDLLLEAHQLADTLKDSGINNELRKLGTELVEQLGEYLQNVD